MNPRWRRCVLLVIVEIKICEYLVFKAVLSNNYFFWSKKIFIAVSCFWHNTGLIRFKKCMDWRNKSSNFPFKLATIPRGWIKTSNVKILVIDFLESFYSSKLRVLFNILVYLWWPLCALHEKYCHSILACDFAMWFVFCFLFFFGGSRWLV